MNYTQNERIEQVSNETLVIGIDIGSQTHYARAFDNRGKELTKRVFSFKNDIDGFNSFDQWAEKIRTENGKEKIMIGCEPTGHYWFAFAKYVTEHKKTLVMVNPFRLRRSRNLTITAPRKRMRKIPKQLQNWW